jgi:hypothetical protein
MLSGVWHHYSRYESVDREGATRQLITAGGGGAYLYPTNHLPRRLMVPPRNSLVRNQSKPEDFKLTAAYPSKARSRRLAWGIFPRMLWRNGSFVALLGLIHMLLMLAGANAVQQMSSAEARLVTIPVSLMIVITFGGTILFAMPRTAGQQKLKHWILGTLHGLAHVGLAVLGTWLWLKLPVFDLTWPVPVLVAIVLYLPLAAIAASLLVSAYLLLASAFYVNENELFAAQGIQGFKHFLRMHIDRDGSLTIYPIAIDRINRRWRAAPQKQPDASWFEPVKPIKVRLVEPPVRIG